MPIINGQYVYDTIPENFTDKSVTGIAPKRADWSDSKTAQYNYLLKQQEQAYNIDLWNLQNQYNSPAAQMQRYQDAGLNPNLIYQQQNTASAPASASASAFRSGGIMARNWQNAVQAIGQIINTVKAARETADYIKYGAEEHAWNRNYSMQRSQGAALENMWNRYLLGIGYDMRPDDPTYDPIPNSPRATMYKYQTDVQYQRYQQLVAVCKMIPDQQDRLKALKALDDYRLQILQGQYGAIMNINTGVAGLDSFLQMLGMYLLGK